MQSAMKIGEMMYQDQQAAGGATPEGGEHTASNPEDAKVVDAEFEEIKEDDKK